MPVCREDLSSSEKYLVWAIEDLAYCLADADAMIDEIVDFTRKGGWHKIDMILPLASDLIFYDDEYNTLDWIRWLGVTAENLKVG